MTETIINALIISAVTALATGFVNGVIMREHLRDLTERVQRIEKYLNGLLREYNK